MTSVPHAPPRQCIFPPHGEIILLVLLITVVCVFDLIWIIRDTRPHPFTDAYPTLTLQFVDHLRESSVFNLPNLVPLLSIEGRSPFYQLLTSPFVLLFGRNVDSMLMLNIGFMGLLLVSVYGLGRTVKDGRVGLLAAFLCATYPTIVNLSHIARPNSAMPACVALSLWLLFTLVKHRSKAIAWWFGFSIGFGMLMRHFFILHLVAPTLVIGFYLLLFQTNPRYPSGVPKVRAWVIDKLRDRFTLYGLLPGMLIAIAMTAGWYLSDTGGQFWNLLDKVQHGTAPVIRGFGEVASHSFWWYAQTAGGAISNVFVLFFFIGVIAVFVNPRLLSFFLLLVIIASYTLLSLQKGLGWHRFAAALPVVAVISALWIIDLPSAILRRSMIATCIVVGSFNYSVVMWGVQSWSRPIAIALGSPLESVAHAKGHSNEKIWGSTFRKDTCSWRVNAVFCPDPAREENWRLSDIAETLLRDKKCSLGTCRVLFVSENENFNQVLLRYYVVQDFPASQYQILPYRACLLPYWSKIRPDWMQMDYIIYIPEWSSYRVGRALTQFLESPPKEFEDVFEPVASFSLPMDWTARLMRRTQEVSASQADRMMASLGLSEKER